MSGLLALLDDVAGIAKMAAASVDDVVAQATKAGAKAAGAVIDDAAVTPKYLHGFDASRELPVIWVIAKGSFKNKLLILLPAGLLLSSFAPWLIPPLLMLGGAFLCLEGAEKVWHSFGPRGTKKSEQVKTTVDPVHLEEQRAAGAIKTDFILSAEIMTIALAEIPPSNIWMEGATLAVVAIGITVIVYGSVALIVKADDVGLYLAGNGRLAITRRLGHGVVKMMPGFMKGLTFVGTAAMLWVGGSIVIHAADVMGFGGLSDVIKGVAKSTAQMVPVDVQGATRWSVTAALDGVFGVVLGLALIPLVLKVIGPLWARVTRRKEAG